MKYELKVEFKDKTQLEKIIKSSYFDDGTKGKLVGQKSSLKIKEDDLLYVVFKGMNNSTIKLINPDIIDGSMRCVVDEKKTTIHLYPCNNYCVVNDEDLKYSFY